MKQRPNIILINCDDLGYGDLGCYGSTKNQSPHIDALARGGLRLTDFYMASPVCSASRAAMLTGCYPPRVGFGERPVLFPGNAIGLNSQEKTIAAYLQDVGYHTKLVGKWHCGDQPEFLPTKHGFDDYFGLPYSNDMGRQSNNLENPPLPLLRNDQVHQQQPDQRGLTERYTDECLQFIQANKDAPFFLYLAHMYVHVPLFVPKQFLDGSENGAYGGAIACIDWSTGVLVDCLKRLGLFENTLIIFTSDNGSRAREEGGSNLPCRGQKGTTWEGGQRVPAILHWPKGIQPGRQSSAVTSAIDLLPTLCEIAGADLQADRQIDGIDLAPLIEGDSDFIGRETFFYFAGNGLNAVRKGDWKLHLNQGGCHGQAPGIPVQELYNLKEDVGETTNCTATHPGIVADLEAELQRMRGELGDRNRGRAGSENRPVGRVENPQTLTEYDASHPYMVAMYDLPDMPTMCG